MSDQRLVDDAEDTDELDTDDQAIEACINWIQEQFSSIGPLDVTFPLSNFTDFPGLIEPTITAIFQDPLVRSTYLSCFREKALELSSAVNSEASVVSLNNSTEDQSNVNVLGETWSEFIHRLEGNPEFSNVDPIDALYLQHFRWPGKHCSGSQSSLSSSPSVNHVLYEKQVITTELDAFITSLQQDKKNAVSDKDSLEFTDDLKRSYFWGIYFVLLLLTLIFVGSLTTGIYRLTRDEED